MCGGVVCNRNILVNISAYKAALHWMCHVSWTCPHSVGIQFHSQWSQCAHDLEFCFIQTETRGFIPVFRNQNTAKFGGWSIWGVYITGVQTRMFPACNRSQCHVWVRNAQLFCSDLHHYRLISGRYLQIGVCLKAAIQAVHKRSYPKWLPWKSQLKTRAKYSVPPIACNRRDHDVHQGLTHKSSICLVVLSSVRYENWSKIRCKAWGPMQDNDKTFGTAIGLHVDLEYWSIVFPFNYVMTITAFEKTSQDTLMFLFCFISVWKHERSQFTGF